MANSYSRRHQSTPLGIWLVAGLAIVGGLSSVAAGLGHIASVWGIPIGVLVLAFGVAELLVGLGLLTRSRTAYRWALTIHAVGGLLDLVGGNLLGVLFSVVVVGYLLTKSAYFR
ncbi:hypothetical protein [Halomarina rubra]|uniref:HdeD family acid-resistance protein n=1 Tax=Halomarina rubra TaxID=2071873 RepID=A0ABD6AQX4_9EURY|nr:hypothetical protein [Halomarina rubra]